jgi:hypothetical protein
MKKIYTLALASTVAFTLLGCANNNSTGVASIKQAAKLDVKTACNPKMGVKALLATAEKFNPIAVKNEIEFMRFGVTNTMAIKATKEAYKSGKSEVALLKKKKYALTSVKDAAWRTCVFAIRPLQMAANTTGYHDAVPGDKFTY